MGSFQPKTSVKRPSNVPEFQGPGEKFDHTDHRSIKKSKGLSENPSTSITLLEHKRDVIGGFLTGEKHRGMNYCDVFWWYLVSIIVFGVGAFVSKICSYYK